MEEVWKKSGYPWSVRLKEILRLWLPWIKKHYQVTAEVEEKLFEISASTMDRHLKPLKSKLKRRIYGRTKPGTLLKHKIPTFSKNKKSRIANNKVTGCSFCSILKFILI